MSKPPAYRRKEGNVEELRPVTKQDIGEGALHAHDDGTPRGALDLLQMDACRWIRPEDVADRSELTALLLLKLLYPLSCKLRLSLVYLFNPSFSGDLMFWLYRRGLGSLL